MAAMVQSVPKPAFGQQNSNVTLTISSSPSGSGGGNSFFRKPQTFNSNSYTQEILLGDGPGRRLRKNVANVRRHVDYVSNMLNHLDSRLWQYGGRRCNRPLPQPDELYQNTALPAWCTTDVPVDCILTKFVRAAMNKVKCPVYSLCWTPEGKRLITGASTGEFTLWNGTAFNFETILQAHDSAIRAMTWSYNGQWLVSADHDGYIKYWQPNMNNVHMYQAHKDEPIRGLCFSPTDLKLASACDDGTACIWDFARCSQERVLRGHGSEVRCIDWHPTKGLIVTGSRDSQQPVKLWDPKTGVCLSTFQGHKSSVMAVEWNKNGNWLLTAGRDHLIKLYDIRTMKEMHTYRGHKKEVTSLAWNPVHENLFVSGGGDGSIAYWLVGNEKEVGLLEHAHDQAIWAMKFHPQGHILATGSNDNNTKFWARNRPGDTQEDIFGLASFTTNMVGSLDKEREPKAAAIRIEEDSLFSSTVIPGMGLDEDVYEKMNREVTTTGSSSGAALLMPDDLHARQQAAAANNRRVLIKQPPPKKAQRQFERMWNVSKPGAAGDEESHHGDDHVRMSSKASLLGPPPPSMLSKTSQPQQGMPPPPSFGSAPLPKPPPMPPGWKPGQPLPLPPNMGKPPLRPSPIQGAPSRPPLIPQPFQAPPPFNGVLPIMSGIMPPPVTSFLTGHTQQRAVAPSVNDSDIDYRSAGQPGSSVGGDIDLRSRAGPPPAALSAALPQQIPSSSSNNFGDSWRTTAAAEPTPQAPAVQDPRMRRQEEIRDPRRRQQDPRAQASTQQPDSQRDWMPRVTNNLNSNQAEYFDAPPGGDFDSRNQQHQDERFTNNRGPDRQSNRTDGQGWRGRGRGRPY